MFWFFLKNHKKNKIYRITYKYFGEDTDTIYGYSPEDAIKKYNKKHPMRDIIDITEIEVGKEYI